MLAPLILCFQEEAPSKRRCYLKEAARVVASFIRHPFPTIRPLVSAGFVGYQAPARSGRAHDAPPPLIQAS
jgi:hypothetical protein